MNIIKWVQSLFPLAITKRIYLWMILIAVISAAFTITLDIYKKVINNVLILSLIWLTIVFLIVLRLSKRVKLELEQFTRAVINNEPIPDFALKELVPIYNLVKQHNQKLLEYAVTVETSNDAIINGNIHGVIFNWNSGAEAILGYSYDEIIGEKLPNLIAKDKRKEFDEIFDKISKGVILPGQKHFDTRYITKAGKEIDVSQSMSVIKDFEGKIIGFSIILRDITEHKLAEDALRKSQEQFYKIFHLGPDIMTINEPNTGIFLDINKNFTKLFAYEREELIGISIYDLKIANTEEFKRLLLILQNEGKVENYEIKFQNKFGKEIILLTSIDYIEFAGDKYLLSSSKDVTALKKYEKEFARLDKLNMIGQMSAGISHEIRNPMTTVRGFLQLLSEKDKYRDEKDIFSLMISELDRANGIISEFLSLAQTKAINMQKNNLNNIVQTLSPLLYADALKMDKNLVLELGDIPDLLLDEKDMRQLILNLVRNGLEAISNGGTVKMKTYCDGDNVILMVQDNGSGIPQEILDDLGTPFVTTKENGTGLGLSICYSIAQRNKANIAVESSSEGTSFYVKFKR